MYDGRYYTLEEGHKEFAADKQTDGDYYVLTLAAIATELKDRGITDAEVIIAAGLPLTWTNGQKAEFSAYLTQNKEAAFTFQRVNYRIRISGAVIYPQGFAAISEFSTKMKGVNMVVDVGNCTMNTMTVINGVPQQSRMFTEQFGTHQCTLAVPEAQAVHRIR